MRYLLTYTIDQEWGDVDTIIFEYPTTLPDYPKLRLVVERVLYDYGLDDERSKRVANNSEQWFVRSMADVDVVVNQEIA